MIPESVNKQPLTVEDAPETLTIASDDITYEFDKEAGTLSKIRLRGRDLVKEGPLLNAWRAPLDNETDEHSSIEKKTLEIKSSAYWNNFSFIHITSANWSNAVKWGWCKGSGIWGDPYIIENITINGVNSPTGDCMFIQGTSEYFIVRNCTERRIETCIFHSEVVSNTVFCKFRSVSIFY